MRRTGEFYKRKQSVKKNLDRGSQSMIEKANRMSLLVNNLLASGSFITYWNKLE